ncbi:MAG: ABC transporter permease [Actinomycetia bacterium]|nr:ABC transporter permease [Actinomycetes bacterium]
MARLVVTARLESVLKSRVTALIALNGAFVLGVGLTVPAFATATNFEIILENLSFKAIILAGMVMLLAAGRFDLSVDGVAALSGITAGLLMERSGVGPLLAVLAGLAVGLGIGLINGIAVEKIGLNPLMTTLATWWAASGAALGLTGGSYPYDFPDSFHAVGRLQFADLLFPIWYAFFFVVLLAIILKFQKFGFHTYATGGGREAARRQGVKVGGVGIGLFVLVALLSAFVGVVFAARIGTAAPNAVDGFALQIIAAGVIGGASLGGGRGSIVGGLLGLLFLQMMSSAAFFLGIDPLWIQSISGVVLLVAIAADAFLRRERDEAGAGAI